MGDILFEGFAAGALIPAIICLALTALFSGIKFIFGVGKDHGNV